MSLLTIRFRVIKLLWGYEDIHCPISKNSSINSQKKQRYFKLLFLQGSTINENSMKENVWENDGILFNKKKKGNKYLNE